MQSRADSRPPLPYEVVAMIFRSLRGRFGNAFVDKFRTGRYVPEDQPNAGKDLGLLEAMDVWAHELRELSQQDIEHGLRCRFKFPPSADEFITAACTRDYGAMPSNQFAALPPARITELDRERAAQHLQTVTGTVRKVVGSTNHGQRLDWALEIARRIERGLPQSSYGAKLAAEALLNARQSIPAVLAKYLPAPANDEDQEAA